MILVMSVFITHQRAVNRYSRYEIFKYTLASYKVLPITEYYFFILLDHDFLHVKEELEAYLNTFGNVHITWDRYTKQEQWIPFIRGLDKDELVWFTQNDDHVFVDYDLDILQEGIDLLKREPNPHKSLYFSHWPEQLKLSGKGKPSRIQHYVKYHLSLLDSIQIFSVPLLYTVFIHYTWKKDHTRIDSVLNELTTRPAEDNPLNQVIYIPLRELCRHFDGYEHVGMKGFELELPSNTFHYDDVSLISKMTAPHQSPWTRNNPFNLPLEWVATNLQLHRTSEHKI